MAQINKLSEKTTFKKLILTRLIIYLKDYRDQFIITIIYKASGNFRLMLTIWPSGSLNKIDISRIYQAKYLHITYKCSDLIDQRIIGKHQ